MGSYEKIKPSYDSALEEVTIGTHRIKVVGHVVSLTGNSCLINDGTSQLNLALANFSSDELTVGSLGRFLITATKTETEFYGELVAFHALTKEQAKQYDRLIKLERKIPKE